MRIPRLLTILGPASVLYVLAARAAAHTASSPEWLVALLSLSLSLTPLGVRGSGRSSRGGASGLALLGASLALAMASSRTGSSLLERVHELAWLVALLTMLDLVLRRLAGPLMRAAVVGGFALAAVTGGVLARHGLLPEATFAVLVVAGIFSTAALHQVLLVGGGHPVEGALSGIALVSVGVGLAYAWFGPFVGLLGTTVEFTTATALWLGHLAWLEPRWRSLRRIGVPLVAACGVCFLMAYAWASDVPLERWQLGLLGAVSGLVWWLMYSLARAFTKNAVWSTSGRLADGAEAARCNLVGATALEDIATAVLVPLSKALEGTSGSPALYTLEPPLRIRLNEGERVSVKSEDPPPAIGRALFAGGHRGVLDLISLRTRVVREPSVRDLVDTMESKETGCVVPCVHLDHIEGLLTIPDSGRAEVLSRTEREELGRLSEALGGALASALTQRRADSHIRELSTLRREAEERIHSLEGEIEQLRGQCDVLGRGLAEDQTLHVAYSRSMRRVQTRAIELAPLGDPVLLVAPAGSPLLPVSRFIHDRGPRWEAPFVVADCSTVPSDQVVSSLFGSEAEQRSGWFESAANGTLLLRDLPALPPSAQARLAVALRERNEDHAESPETSALPPRLIASSRSSLAELRRRGALDERLAACFSSPGLQIPPLRDRREDVPSLALLAIDRACRVLPRDPVGIEQEAMGALVAHDWPGDVAELELVIELAVAKAASKSIRLTDLPPLTWPKTNVEESLSGTYLEVERRLLERALLRSGGNKSEAARMLGLKRTTFLDKLRRHELERAPHRDLGGSATG